MYCLHLTAIIWDSNQSRDDILKAKHDLNFLIQHTFLFFILTHLHLIIYNSKYLYYVSELCLIFYYFRDVALIGTCDDGCYKLAELLGWKVSF